MTDSEESLRTQLYVVPGCPLCADARRMLESKGITYIEHDVTEDYAALRRMFRLTRQKLVPVIQNGDIALVRPTEAQLDSLHE